MRIVIGGPRHGELVDWPIDNRYWSVPDHSKYSLTDVMTMHYYRARRLILFDREIYIWLSERYNPMDTAAWVEPFLHEILSYKGGQMFYSEVQDVT